MAFEKFDGGSDKESPAEPRGSSKKARRNNHEDLGFEAKLWKAADMLRSNTDAAEDKQESIFTHSRWIILPGCMNTLVCQLFYIYEYHVLPISPFKRMNRDFVKSNYYETGETTKQ